jgi:hypothetical protein
MTDMTLIVAEMRADELLTALQAAADGAPHWRSEAKHLLRSIADLELPEPVPEQLREVDARRRALETCDNLAADDD